MATFFNPAALQGGRAIQPRLPQCGRCGLYKECHSPKMKPTGKGKRSILFVGEAPGEEEDRQGVQLVGKSGKHLRNELRRLKVNLDDCHKTNAIICRPPDNQIQDLHVECCRPNLLKTIRELKPRVIVLLGGSAIRSLMPTEREASVGAVSRWVGWTIPSHEYQAWLCPTYHPSYLLRMDSKVLDAMFRGHLKRALALEDKPVPGESLEVLKQRVEVITSTRDARLRLKGLAKKKGVLAFDYECTGLKPDHHDQRIVTCSWSLNGEDTFAHVVDDTVKPYMSRILRSGRFRKVASNLKHEERWTIAKLGHPVKRWWWDTMLASHVHDNRGSISSLKYQAFIHFGIADYDRAVAPYFENVDERGFNKIDQIPLRDLLTYNALDSLLEVMVMRKQRKALGFA